MEIYGVPLTETYKEKKKIYKLNNNFQFKNTRCRNWKEIKRKLRFKFI